MNIIGYFKEHHYRDVSIQPTLSTQSATAFFIEIIIFDHYDADTVIYQDIRERVQMSDIQTSIINFIKENFIMGRSETKVDPEESLIESGIMDSTGVLELVEFLEATFNIQVEDEELVPENLETVKNITEFLKTKGIS